MSTARVSRRTVLQTMVMGVAGVAVSACGGGGDPAPPAATPEPAPAPAPIAEPSPAVASVPEPAATPAGPLPLLSPSDPAAVPLKYTTDASQVDAAAPTFVKGQACANCIQYQGASGESHGPCTIFPGKAVAATGWCMAYVKKA